MVESTPTTSASATVEPATALTGQAQLADTPVNFKGLIRLPKVGSRPASSKRKRAVAHATIVTTSPYLKQVQTANAKKAAAELRKESKRQSKTDCGARRKLAHKFESEGKKQNVRRKKKDNHKDKDVEKN